MFAEGELDDEGRRRAERVRASIPTPDVEAALSALLILEREDLRPRLAKVEVPTHLVHCEADPICPVGASRAMASAIPQATLVVIPGAGHAPFVSRPDAFREALLSFIREVA
jgi:pimeloyl-[acyl-carrier protein] methyl ester esterase